MALYIRKKEALQDNLFHKPTTITATSSTYFKPSRCPTPVLTKRSFHWKFRSSQNYEFYVIKTGKNVKVSKENKRREH
jgi:hypothetical protein